MTAKLSRTYDMPGAATLDFHSGGSIATVQARLVDEEGALYATGTTTCLILTPR